ncbi:DUF1496 domain-containing protein [Aeromonas salmonicida subsp. pectinolytica]
MNRIKGGTTCLLLAMLGTSGVAAEPAKVTRAEVGTEWVLPLGSLPERICWYQDQKYSLGARIQQGNRWLECGPQNEQETNGSLAWRLPPQVTPVTRAPSDSETISLGQ